MGETVNWFDKINSEFDAEHILAGYCLCRHPPERHRDGRCDIWDCAVECIIPPPFGLVKEARQFLKRRAAKGAEETVANIECTYCRDLDRRVRAVRGNVLCTDGKRRDVCADHYRAYAWRVS